MNHQIFIGIGGMGVETLRGIKKRVLQRLEPDDPNRLEPTYHNLHFLALDVDDMDRYGNQTREDPLTREEKLELFVPKPMPQHLVQWVQKHAPWYEEREMYTQQWSRVHLWCHAEEICRWVKEATKEASDHGMIYVHVFAGLAGNTGGGCFTDVCYLVRQALASVYGRDLPSWKMTILGYCYLPELMLHRPGLRENQTIRAALMANGYAALQNLDDHMKLAEQDKWFQRDYRNLGTYQTQQPPVDIPFLFSDRDCNNRIAKDSYTSTIQMVAEFVLNFLTEAKCLWWYGRPFHTQVIRAKIVSVPGARYHSLGVSTCRLPTKEIATYLAEKTCEKLRDQMPGSVPKELYERIRKNWPCIYEMVKKRVTEGIQPLRLPEVDAGSFPTEGQIYMEIQSWQHGYRIQLDKNIDQLTAPSKHVCPENCSDEAVANLSDQLFDWLIQEVVKNPKYGATVAAKLLEPDGMPGVPYVLDAILMKATGVEREALEKQRESCYQEAQAAKEQYLNSRFVRRNKFKEYLHCLTKWCETLYSLDVLKGMEKLTLRMKHRGEELYGHYFRPLKDLMDDLSATLFEELKRIENGDTWRDEENARYIRRLDVLQGDLDQQLQAQDADWEYVELVSYLLDHDKCWLNWNSAAAERCINDYIQEHFMQNWNKSIEEDQRPTSDDAGNTELRKRLRDLLELVQKETVPQFPPANQSAKRVSQTFLFIPDNEPMMEAILTVNPSATGYETGTRQRITCIQMISRVSLEDDPWLGEMEKFDQSGYGAGNYQ